MTKLKLNKKNAVSVETETTIDTQTGELIQQTETVLTKVYDQEPDYVKLYTADIGKLLELPGCCPEVLSCIASHMAYGNIIVLYGPIKEIMMAELNMNRNTFNKAIDELYKAGILIRHSRACYVVDPELFGKGQWKDVKKLRLSIEYLPNGNKQLSMQVTKEIEGQKQPAIEEFGKQIKARPKISKALAAARNQLSMDFDSVDGEEAL